MKTAETSDTPHHPSVPSALPWPKAALDLFRELTSSAGRIALLAGPSDGEQLLAPLSEALGLEVAAVGRLLTRGDTAPTAESSRALLADVVLIDNADILFAPELEVDPLALLRTLARQHPVVMHWPGTIREREAIYSEPGRRDYYQQRLTDAIVLHPVARHFPDQSPYRIERIP